MSDAVEDLVGVLLLFLDGLEEAVDALLYPLLLKERGGEGVPEEIDDLLVLRDLEKINQMES
jgi:hypothetical protein